MNTRAKLIACVLPAMAIALGAHSVIAADAEDPKIISTGRAAEIGKPAPDFKLRDINGKTHRLSDLRGKVVVLEWINHECPVVNRCHDSGAMKSTMKRFKEESIAWLAIDSSRFCEEKIVSIRKWAKEKKIEYPYLLDASGRVGRAFGAKTTPHMFVIDAKGNLAYSGALDNDPDGTLEKKRNYVERAIMGVTRGFGAKRAKTKPYGCSVKYKK